MRAIQVSHDVFAAIWKLQQPGETTEDAILARHLQVLAPAAEVVPQKGTGGFRDPRYGVHFPEGFEIFRTYLGTEYRAKATSGQWLLLSTGGLYPSLNELSRAIGARTENAWTNWYFADAAGKRVDVSTLRDESKIVHRRPQTRLGQVTAG